MCIWQALRFSNSPESFVNWYALSFKNKLSQFGKRMRVYELVLDREDAQLNIVSDRDCEIFDFVVNQSWSVCNVYRRYMMNGVYKNSDIRSTRFDDGRFNSETQTDGHGDGE